jgi:NAD(P)H dehydrogenase (quinone)
MAKVLLVYYSRSGNTAQMAEQIRQGLLKGGVEVTSKTVAETRLDELLEYDGIVMGSPTYYGSMAAELKKLLDDSVKFHGKLDGKVGGAFTSSGALAGGNETTILHILGAMLVHGMVVQGDPRSDHYGPVAVGKPDERSQKACARYGERVASLVCKLASG